MNDTIFSLKSQNLSAEEQSVLLAQTNLLNKLAFNRICGSVHNICQEDEMSIDLLINDGQDPSISVPLIQSEIADTIKELAKRAYDNMLYSPRGISLISKAEFYNIPYNKDRIDWLDLTDLVEDYEALLSEAKEANVSWDPSDYDPEALRQEIEEVYHRAHEERRDLYNYFYATRGC